MNRSFIYKIISILVLVALMAIAVGFVNGIILERQQRQFEARANISQTASRAQTVVGPVLVISYIEEFSEIIVTDKEPQPITKSFEGKVYFFPEELKLKGSFANEMKSLGIYKALIFQLGGNINGQFKIPKNLGLKLANENSILKITEAYLSIGITDTKGLSGKPVLNWAGIDTTFKQGSKIDALKNGIYAPVRIDNTVTEQKIAFEFKLDLRGTESFNFTPIAENNVIALSSSWQSPRFYGSFSPDAATQKIGADGFSANWAITSLSSNNQAALMQIIRAGNAKNQTLESLSVGFVEPINVYSQADRATKYGLLFIGLTFAGFFIFEVLKQLRIHPAQYTFVGLAMALFYLLLVSLAEQIGFAYAYLVASAACVSLLGYYLSYVLKGKFNGLLFASLLTALYGALYGILASEDNALVMGSLLVFSLLALVMITTRKVDWYTISSKPELPQTHSAYDIS